MNHLYFTDTLEKEYPITLLVPSIKKEDIKNIYFTPYSIDINQVLVVDLHYSKFVKKTPMKEIRQFIDEELLQVFKEFNTKILLVADSEYFKALTKLPKVEPYLGYTLPCSKEYGDYSVIYVPNYRQMFYDPIKVTKGIEQGMNALSTLLADTYQDPGKDIIHYEYYPRTNKEIEIALESLLKRNIPLTIDIEAFSLKHTTSGIGTISFAWNQHEGIAFPVDCDEIVGATEAPYSRQVYNKEVRELLKDFFIRYLNKAIYHNISFDVYVLIYQLFMDNIIDTKGLLNGLSIMCRNWDCTKLISYLATNSCAGNNLSLKYQAQEFAGNYAVDDIKDITLIPMDKLLKYNLVDSLSTWFTYNKNYSVMIADQQYEIYKDIFTPAIKDIIQMQLTGLPININRVKEVNIILQTDETKALDTIKNSSLVQEFTYRLNENYANKMNAKWKKKRITPEECNEVFNPNSPNQLQELLYDMIGLPIISLTDTKQPSVDGDTLKALKNHTTDSKVLELLEAVIDFKLVNKILTSFIPSMLNSSLAIDGWHYLFGKFNLGGTVSCRLSSSDPNLQTIPANSKYAKLIKSCIQAAHGWVFIGVDFSSLEDKISGLTTKDPNKLKVYTDGYDGHSLRTYAYFKDQCIGIVDTVESINTIQKLYPKLRFDSKAPTFALTYQGTFKTLMTNCGFTEEVAKAIEKAYHELYEVSDRWVAGKLNQACKDGYITAAFGLRVRTPLLAQVIRGTSKTPFQAEAEGRTAGNALGQSWCLLNTRAGSEFLGKVRNSDFKYNILPCAQIHDAQYFIIKDDIETVMYCNQHLIEAIYWQDHPEIAHDEVKLGGELALFYPSWANEISIKNNASEEDIKIAIQKHIDKLNEPPKPKG